MINIISRAQRIGWMLLVLILLQAMPGAAHGVEAQQPQPTANGNHHYIIFVSGWQCLPVATGNTISGNDKFHPRDEWKTIREALAVTGDGGKAVALSAFAEQVRALHFDSIDSSRFLYYSYTGKWNDKPDNSNASTTLQDPDYTYSDTHFHDRNGQGAECPDKTHSLVWDLARNRGSDDFFSDRATHINTMIDTIVATDDQAEFTIISHSQGAAIATYWAGSNLSQNYRNRINVIVTLHGFTKGLLGLQSYGERQVYVDQVVEKMNYGVKEIPVYSIRHCCDFAALPANTQSGTWLSTEIQGFDNKINHWLAKDNPSSARAIALVVASNSVGTPNKSVPLQAGRHDQPFNWLGAGGLFDILSRSAIIPISIPVWNPNIPVISSGPLTASNYVDLYVNQAKSADPVVRTHRPTLQFDPGFPPRLSASADLEWRWEVNARPPIQSTDGLKSFVSKGTSLTHRPTTYTAENYVQYSDAVATDGVDLIAVIDASGSMQGIKFQQAQEAAILLLNQASTNDQIGAVAFKTGSSVVYPLSTASDTAKTEAERGIRSTIPDGMSTSIGAGLQSALSQIQQNGKTGNQRVLVLLTDGQENAAPLWKDVESAVLNADVTIYTVGLGLGSNTTARSLLQEIANKTGGRFYDTPNAQDLLQIYSEIASAVQGRQLYQITKDTVPPNSSQVYPAHIDGGTKQIQFQLTWSNVSTNLNLALVDPAGIVINASNYSGYGGNVTYTRGNTYVIFDVNQPKPGQWSYTVINSPTTRMMQLGKDVARAVTDVDFTVNVNGISDLTVENLSESRATFLNYEPFVLGVDLFDPAPVITATVVAQIAKPDGTMVAIPLKNKSIDSGPVFAGEYFAEYVPDQIGTYSVRINANGIANDGNQFERSLSFSVFVETNPQPPADMQVAIVKIPDTDPANPEFCIAYRNDGIVNAQDVYLYLLQNMNGLASSFGSPTDKGDGNYEWRLGVVPGGTGTTERIRLSASTAMTDGIAFVSINDGISLDNSLNPNFDPATTPTYDPQLSNNGGMSGNEDIEVTLHQGWNLIGMPKEFLMRTPQGVLCPLSAELDVVLGFDEQGITYDPALPEFSTLKEFDPLHGYWFRTNTDGKLRIPGYLLAANEPIALNKGWNLVGYLPKQSLVITDALTTIADKYDTVLGFDGGAASYSVNIPPQLNTLQQFTPGSAFWIHMLEAAVLQYPTNPSATTRTADYVNRYQATSDIAATNEWINIYSTNSTYNGQPLTPGSVVTAVGEDGRSLGQITVRDEGWYGLLAVYGDDAYTDGLDGARPGEHIRFLINNQPATITNGANPVWTANGDLVQVDLAATGPQMDRHLYLPNVGR